MKCYLLVILFIYYRINLLFKFIDKIFSLEDFDIKEGYKGSKYYGILPYDSRWNTINKSINSINSITSSIFSYLLINFLFFYSLFVLDDISLKLFDFSFIFFIDSSLLFVILSIVIAIQNGIAIFYKNRLYIYIRYFKVMDKKKYKRYSWGFNIIMILLIFHFLLSPLIRK